MTCRGVIFGPGITEFDLALVKNTKLTDAKKRACDR